MAGNDQGTATALEEQAAATKRAAIMRGLNILSFSELEAVKHILQSDELKTGEGLLVCSKLADQLGITRSVIVNALRKLESAGVLKSRSLGMKGTRIEMLIPEFSQAIRAS